MMHALKSSTQGLSKLSTRLPKLSGVLALSLFRLLDLLEIDL